MPKMPRGISKYADRQLREVQYAELSMCLSTIHTVQYNP